MRELLAVSFQRDFDRFHEELMKKRKETKKSPLRPSAIDAQPVSLAIRYGRTYGEVYVQASGVCSESDGTRRLDDRQRRRRFTPDPGATTH